MGIFDLLQFPFLWWGDDHRLNPHKRTRGAPIAKPAPPRNHGPQRKKNRGGKSHNRKRSR